MKKYALAAMGIALLFPSCSHPAIRTLALPKPNPTSYTFPLNVNVLHSRAKQAFAYGLQMEHPIFYFEGRSVTLNVQDSQHHLFAPDAIFRDPANTNDLYLHNYGWPIAESIIYRGTKGGLTFFADFHLHLAETETNSTTVTVTALNTRVVNGWNFGLDIHTGFGRLACIVPAQPTTVEEYSILLYLGRYIGVTGMPELIVPTE